MSHGGLSRPEGNTPLAQERAEGRSQGVHVERSVPFVALGDLGGGQIAVEDPDETGRHTEDRRVARKSRRNRLAAAEGIRLERCELVPEPGPKVVRQVGADDHAIPLPALLIVRVKFDVGDRLIEPELSYAQSRQFILSESAQHQRFVNQGSLSADRIEPLADFGFYLADGLPLLLAPSHCHRFEQGSAAGDVEQSQKLGFRHRPPLATRVRLLVGAGRSVKGLAMSRPTFLLAHQLPNDRRAVRSTFRVRAEAFALRRWFNHDSTTDASRLANVRKPQSLKIRVRMRRVSRTCFVVTPVASRLFK